MKTRTSFVILIVLALTLPVAMLLIAKAAASSSGPLPRPQGPGDIYAAAGFPCVAAHSTTRALYATYNGPLYQVTRQSDDKTLDIGVVQPSGLDAGGYADAAEHDAFCANTICFIKVIYDQSDKSNHLYQAPPGTFKGPAKGGFNTLPIADMAPVTIDGHKTYGVFIMPGMGFRNNNATGIAINDEPEGIYYVVNGKHYDSGCCFDYGNSSPNGRAVGTGTMETVYFGTATAWGSGSGPGPWIMSDMEAGLFSGYNAKQNAADPTIDSWRFVTAVMDGGGGNKWDLRGGNAQQGGLTTFYSGVRPGSSNNASYFPMRKPGAILLGNGGDNGNGSAGTFYEGVITTGYPTEATTDAVQSNIVAAKYDELPVSVSRVKTFTPRSSQDATVTFKNITGAPVTGVRLSVSLPARWTSVVSGTTAGAMTFTNPIAPGVSLSATFKVTSPATTGAGFLIAKAEWTGPTASGQQSETIGERVRNVLPVKINEIRFSNSANATDQFIELYNASDAEVDLSNWALIHTWSQWAPVKLATIPSGTKLAAHGFYLLGLSSSGLAAPVSPGATNINIRSTTGFEVGQKIEIEGETRTIASAGTAASAATTLFIPVSTGPRLTIAAGSTNLPVTSAAGFEVGQKIGIDIGGNYEVATVTAVGKAATQTTLSAAATAGATNIKVAAVANISVGDALTVGTGGRKELVTVTRIGTPASGGPAADGAGRGGMGGRGGRGAGVGGGADVDLATPLKFDHMSGIDVSDLGTGISFAPATRFPHVSGDAVQALGSGITLDSPLVKGHEYGAAVVSPLATSVGYQGPPAPRQWFGDALATSAGSLALMDASGAVVVDALVYGSQQSNSSGNGTITSPELATLEGDQTQGGCIVVAPGGGRGGGFGGRGGAAAGSSNRSVGRFPDGTDTDSNCRDFLVQTAITLAADSAARANNIKVPSVAEFGVGQTITIDTGANRETAVIATVGTAGGTSVNTAVAVGATAVPVSSTEGFSVGQTITIDSGTNRESAVVATVPSGGRGGGRGAPGGGNITVAAPLTMPHEAGAQVYGTGITLTAALTKAHASGAQVGSGDPTPGAPNRYLKRN
jgi:non-reducing end alpha-L-arabinofuranosidase